MTTESSVTETTQPQSTTEATAESAVAAAAAKQDAQAAPKEPVQSNAATIAAIAREKKKALEEKKKIQAERDAIAKERKELEEFRSQMQQAKTNPIAALQAAGFSYKDATDFVLNNSSMTAEQQIRAVQDEIKAMREGHEAEKKADEEKRKQQAEAEYKQVIENFKAEVNQFLDEKKEEYELIHFTESQELVFSTIEEHFNKTKKVLSMKEASDLVEQYLEERTQKAITETKKLKSKFQLAMEKKEAEGVVAPSKTLSNSATVSTSSASMLPAKTEQERMRRALAALGGN